MNWWTPQLLPPTPPEYPYAALPTLLLAGIQDVHRQVMAPPDLACTCGVTVLSAAAQHRHDILLPNSKRSPAGIYTVAIAETGTGKSACEGPLFESIRAIEEKASAAYKAEEPVRSARLAAIKAQEDELLASIKRAVDDEQEIADLTDRLAKLHRKKADLAKPTRFLHDNTTERAMLDEMANGSGRAALLSDEASRHFSGRTFNDTATWTQAWDGKRLIVSRVEFERVINRPRLTLGLGIQNKLFDKAMSDRPDILRASGLLPRILLVRPVSTQGTRFLSEEPLRQVNLKRLHQRLDELYQSPESREPLTFTPPARKLWTQFNNRVEEQMGVFGRYASVKDAASRTSDNAGRLAALFYQLENDGITITEEYVERGLMIAEWHLEQYLVIFGPKPEIRQDEVDANVLESWLRYKFPYAGMSPIIYPLANITQYAPREIRERTRICDAVQFLCSTGRADVLYYGRKKLLQLRPRI